ncbi:MAG: hypothetical protein L3K23_09780 [Thermoplasmata archaeon]|nr:hypothetical protein [Thermoplasmata archaeon]
MMGESGTRTSLLRRLLDAAGYRLEDRPAGLKAVRNRDRRVVLVVAGSPSPAEVELEFPPDSLHRTIIYTEDPGPAARSVASERGLEVLDAQTLGPAMGELLLPSPVALVRDTDDAEEGEGPLEPPPSFVPTQTRTVRPRLSEEDARTVAGVEEGRYVLRLVPFYVAPYRVRTPTPHGRPGTIADHLVAVNALSGRVDVWEVGERDLVEEIELPSERLEPTLSEHEARERAESALRRHHTVSVDHTEQHAGALIIERRKVPPGPSDLAIGTAVVLHVPFWYAESSGGRVVVDAVSGGPVAELDEAR